MIDDVLPLKNEAVTSVFALLSPSRAIMCVVLRCHATPLLVQEPIPMTFAAPRQSTVSCAPVGSVADAVHPNAPPETNDRPELVNPPRVEPPVVARTEV